MEKRWQKAAFNLLNNNRTRVIMARILIVILLLISLGAHSQSDTTVTPLATKQQPEIHNTQTQKPIIEPYQAIYAISYGSMDATLKRTLKKVNKEKNIWQLSNEASFLFMSSKEQAHFKYDDSDVQPINYIHKNSISAKRNSHLSFNPVTHTVTDPSQFKSPITINAAIRDKLSFQIQLRLDAMKSDGDIQEKTYGIFDTKRVKKYTVNKIGEETIITPAGTFQAIKYKQFRPQKNKHTFFWLDKNNHYFLLRLDRFKKGKLDYQIQLQQVTTETSSNNSD